METKKKYCQPYLNVSFSYKQCVLIASIQDEDPFVTEKKFEEWW